MSSSEAALWDGLLVTVTPAQSAFFAGELFSATVTFSNPAPKHAHRGNQRSNSSAPRTTAPSQLNHPNAPSDYAQSSSSLSQYANGSAGYFDNQPGSTQDARPSSSGVPSHLRPDSQQAYSGGVIPPPTSGHNSQLNPPHPSASGPLLRSVSGLSTSPSTPSTSKGSLPTRKGLIGKPLAPVLTDRRMASGIYQTGPRKPGGRAHSRSQSMAVSSPDLLPGGGVAGADRGVGGPPPVARKHGRSRLGGSMVIDMSAVPALTRPVSNGRRAAPPAIAEEGERSPVDSEEEDLARELAAEGELRSQSPAGDGLPPGQGRAHHPSTHPYGQPARAGASSTFSLAQSDEEEDALDASQHVPGRGFYSQGNNETMDSVVQAGVDEWKRKASAHGPPQPTPRHPPWTPSLHPPNTLGLLWSFAHLEGTFEVDDMLIKSTEFLEVKRALLGGAAGVGGGTLGERRGRSGWRDWIWGKDGGKGASLEERKEKGLREKTVPTFSSPPSILGVDLVLEPSESKSCKLPLAARIRIEWRRVG